MRWSGGRTFLLLVLTFVASATAQEAGTVVGTAATPQVEALPRETVTLRLSLQNEGEERTTFTPIVTPPMGWALLVPPGDVQLEAGESRVVVFSLLVAPGAEAGTYLFPVTFFLTRDGPQHEVIFAVRVPAIDAVTLTRLEAPTYVASERFITRFLLRNDGNSRQVWHLTAHSSASLPLELDPESVVLDPGEAIEVLVRASVPPGLDTSITHALTLRAEHPDLPDVQAVARSTSELIPRNPSTTGALHTFPLTVRFALEASHEGTARLAGPTVELYGTGALNDRDPGRLTIRLKSDLRRFLTPEELVVSYRDARNQITVGDQAFSRSTLVADENGFGIRAERQWQPAPHIGLTGSAVAYASDTGLAVGAAIEAVIEGGFTAGSQLHLSPGGSTVTVDVGYRAPAADPTRLELALLEASYAVRSAPGQDVLGHAFRVHARLREGASAIDFRYRTRTAAFTASWRHEATVNLRAALRLNEALRIDPGSPADLHLEYTQDRSWPASGAPAEDRTDHTFGGTLTTRLGRTSLSVGHREEVTQEDATTARQGTSHVEVYLPLGEHASLRQRLSWVRTDPEGDGSHLLYEATGVTTTGEAGRLTGSLEAGLALNVPRVDTLDLGARWAGPLSATWFLQAEGSVDLLARGDVVTLEGEARKRFANEHELEVGLDVTVREARPPRAVLAVAYAVPLHVPLGLRSDVGTITGSVHTARGQPLQGVIVTAAGSTAVTNADGSFILPAVAQGQHLVHLVPTTIPVQSPVIAPASPAVIEVRPGETANITFEVTPGATIAGRLVPQAAAPNDDRSLLVPQSNSRRWLQGATVELTNGTTTLRATTDTIGSFQLTRVPSGTWTVRLRHPTLPGDYRIEPAEHQLQVHPGERTEVEFQLVPVTRTIRFQDGGRLGGNE